MKKLSIIVAVFVILFLMSQTNQASGPMPEITIASPNGGESWNAGTSHSIVWTYQGTVGNVKIDYSADNGASWQGVVSSTTNTGSYSWTVPNTPSAQCLVKVSETDGYPSATSANSFSIVSNNKLLLGKSRLNFGVQNGQTSENQTLLIDNTGGGTFSWSTSTDRAWLLVTPTSGKKTTTVSVGVDAYGLTPGTTYRGTVTVVSPEVSNSPQTVDVFLTVFESGQGSPPFGEFTTPQDGSKVSGSVPFTGWALDDVEVESVKIYNGNDYVGDAVFVAGARPDVETTYAAYPNNDQAGWGYMLLTNSLPNGTCTFYVKATDTSGNEVVLGSKTITVDNQNALKPFGAIDTPTQGGSASGSSFQNSGWVLTPQPNSIPKDGSTISVYVDGVDIGHPTYNNYRSDIANAFPGYANSDGAGAIFYIDTTGYSEGLHTIHWTATDSAGNQDGIGSRYFSINNGRGFNSDPLGSSIEYGPGDGSSGPQAWIHQSTAVRASFDFGDDESIEVYLGQMFTDAGTPPYTYRGYQKVDQFLRPLPVGSTLDSANGIFYWAPGPAFQGTYALVFERIDGAGEIVQQNASMTKRYSPSPAIPTLSAWGALLFMGLIAVVGIRRLRKQ